VADARPAGRPSPAARRAGVLGSPIAHSLSPALHRAAYAELGLDWTYDAFEVDETTLPAFIASLDDTWAGLSLTMPLKECVIGLLVDVDGMAAKVGAVNTVLPGAGGWTGTNTDITGMTRSLSEAGLAAGAATATVLGAGATARSAVAALSRLGASSVRICARRPEAADAVATLAEALGLTADTGSLVPDVDLVTADIVISTLPGAAAEPWAAVAPHAGGALLDASYHPWPSALAAAWGSPVVASGRDMLVWQAVEQVRLMTGREPSVAAMRAALPA
jgi:shikimate dehydrogenase